MIAFSSANLDKGQFSDRVKSSWLRVFDDFNVLNADSPPSIQWLIASTQMNNLEYYCLINSDILLSEKFKGVEHRLKENSGQCAVSRRFEFDPNLPMPQKTASVDLGMDCFIAVPWVWERVWRHIPEHFHIGRPQWDTWLHGFFNHHYRGHYYDFSKWGCVFHPKHERKPWTGPVLPIPWEAKDLEPPQELPLGIPALTKASHAPAFT